MSGYESDQGISDSFTFLGHPNSDVFGRLTLSGTILGGMFQSHRRSRSTNLNLRVLSELEVVPLLPAQHLCLLGNIVRHPGITTCIAWMALALCSLREAEGLFLLCQDLDIFPRAWHVLGKINIMADQLVVRTMCFRQNGH